MSASGLPDPLVPSDCDIRDVPAMLVDIQRLAQSKAWLRAGRVPFLAFRLFNLWGRAFHEVPAGSIENDDDVLCDAAKCPPTEYEAAKADMLRGWVACNDGRLYHPVVAEKVLDLWSSRLKARHGAAVGRARKAWERKGKPGDPPAIDLMSWLKQQHPASYAMADHIFTGDDLKGWEVRDTSGGQVPMSTGQTDDSGGRPEEVRDTSGGQVPMSTGKCSLSEAKLSQGKVSSVEAKASTGAAAPVGGDGDASKPAWWPRQDQYGRVVSELTEKIVFDVGKAILGKSAGGQITKLRKTYRGHYDALRNVVDLLLQAEDKADPGEWFAAVVRNAEVDEPALLTHEKYPEHSYR